MTTGAIIFMAMAWIFLFFPINHFFESKTC